MAKRFGLILLVLLSLPVILPLYNPSMNLGGYGLLLGLFSITISPLILFVALIYMVKQLWK